MIKYKKTLLALQQGGFIMADKEYADCAGCDFSDYMAAEEQDLEDMTFCQKYNQFVKEQYNCQYASYERFKSVATEIIEENKR